MPDAIKKCLIAARSANNVIGRHGTIPWRIPGEQTQFKELTMGNVVVMGRRTYEDIGRPLPGRYTVVVSGTKHYEGENLATISSVNEAISLAEERLHNIYPKTTSSCHDISHTDILRPCICFAGGYSIYKEVLPIVDVMYITEVDTIIEDGDVFFPGFDEKEFDIIKGESGGDDIKYTRYEYRRRFKILHG